VGQQRKLKEIINWLKKKKRRTIRKDELISFLIGKQVSYSNSNNNLSSIFASSATTISTAASSSSNASGGGMFNASSGQSQMMSGGAVIGGSGGGGGTLGMAQSTGGNNAHHQNVFFGNAKQQLFRPSPPFAQSQHQSRLLSANPNSNTNSVLFNNANSATCPSSLASLNQGSLVSNSDTSSDLATFREALIMHSKLLFKFTRSTQPLFEVLSQASNYYA
jgi:hypothetical protein